MNQGEEYQRLCDQLKEHIMEMEDKANGEKIVDKVFFRNEIYHGTYLQRAADIIVIPKDGYDFKGNLTADNLTFKGELVGMHTYDDAFLYINGMKLTSRKPEIIDVLPTIFDLMKVEIPRPIEGNSLLGNLR